MLRLLSVTCGLALLAAAPSSAQEAADPATLFGAREGIEGIDLSPDGQRIVYLAPGPGASTAVLVQDLSGQSQPRVALRSDNNPERVRWCRFVTNDRLVCQISILQVNGAVITPFRRLVSLDADGGHPRLMGQQDSFYDAYVRQFDGAIIDWLPGENGAVLMSRSYVPEEGRMNTRLVRTSEGLGVDRVDVRTLRSTRAESPNRNASSYLTDGRGHVRIMGTLGVRGATGQLASRVEYFYRPEAGGDWRPFSTFNTLTDEGLRPIAVDATLNAAYALQKLNGRLALYRVRLDGSLATELVYANERVDVDDVVRLSNGSRVIGLTYAVSLGFIGSLRFVNRWLWLTDVTYAEEVRRIVYFDTEFAALSRSLGRAIPNLPQINFVGGSADGNRLLIRAGSDSDPGRYFTFDRTGRRLNEVLLDRPALERVTLASVRPVSYPSSDGAIIPAYLTLPPGRDPRNLPAVILPHGGPSARDEWGFDWLAQYLAHLGYAVLQPNYRGSAGFGDQWLQQNGYRSWQISIGDVTAGARWLAAQGIANPQRMAIVGWSYGGYAALQAGVTEPGLFKAIVAIAPVTDLQQLKDDQRGFSDSRNFAEVIGTGPHITQGSPLQNVSRMAAPVMLFHGSRDLNVRAIHSERMDRDLRSAGKQSELVVFPGLEHDLSDSTARTRMLREIRAFLATELGDS